MATMTKTRDAAEKPTRKRRKRGKNPEEAETTAAAVSAEEVADAPAVANKASSLADIVASARTDAEILADAEADATITAEVEEEIKPWNFRALWKRRQEQRKLEGSFDAYPHLLALKPKEGYLFRSDNFEIDSSTVACILAYFHDDAANDSFAPFWGIDRIPDGLDSSVTAVVLEQVEKKDDKWIEQYIKQSEKLENLDRGEQNEAGTTSSRRKAAKISGDRDEIIGELQDGAAYLNVHNRLLLKAPTLEILEESIERITRLYIDRFGTLKVAPYAGEQRQELSALTKSNEKKRGKGFHHTSTEFAGSYSLVTNGLNDNTGEYVGYMVGDVNSSAVLMDTNGFDHHVVIADGGVNEYLDRVHVSNMWGSKISQSALLSNASVVHLVLDGTDLDKLGPKLDRLTSRVDLNSGDVNMFEMFGSEEDELSVYAQQMQKLTLMFEQLYESEDASVGSIIRSELEKMVTQFYIDQRMWAHNAKNNRSRLRVVGIPHEQVPRLQMFVSYLDTAHKALVNSEKNDPDQLRAYNVLKGVANNMLSTNGDLFNSITATAVDGVRDSRRVVYDFSRLMRRGKGVAMAQLVNIVSFAIGRLGRGDVVIIHGTEQIDDGIKGYLTTQFEQLFDRGGRVVYSYNDVDKMLEDEKFNKFDTADFTIFGAMRDRTVTEYQRLLQQSIPRDLANLVTRRGEGLTYLRRGTTNVVFHMDITLGIAPAREKQRREMERLAAKAENAHLFAALDGGALTPGAGTTRVGPARGLRPDDDSNGAGDNGKNGTDRRENNGQGMTKKRQKKDLGRPHGGTDDRRAERLPKKRKDLGRGGAR